MKRLILILSTCVIITDGFGTMLVQGRSDTIRALRNIVRHSSQPALSSSPRTWHIPPELLEETRDKKSNNVRYMGKVRSRRHINSIVIESGQCDHIELVDCSDFETDEMTCMLTATGMTCCVCTGVLRAAKRSLF